jgi:hypothetical protein
MRVNWFWGLIGFLGIMGFILDEPLYYIFFVFFLFFLEPVVRTNKKKKTSPNNSNGKEN